MSGNLRILGMCGSLRKGSYNMAALRACGKMLPEDAELTIFDIGTLPLFNQDLENEPPQVVKDFKLQIKEADAVIIASPEYNYSFSGVLKNALDWGSRPFGQSAWDGKPAAIIGASTGILGTARSQYPLRQVLVGLNMHPLNRPEIMIGGAAAKFDREGNLADEETRKRLKDMILALADWTVRLKKA